MRWLKKKKRSISAKLVLENNCHRRTQDSSIMYIIAKSTTELVGEKEKKNYFRTAISFCCVYPGMRGGERPCQKLAHCAVIPRHLQFFSHGLTQIALQV